MIYEQRATSNERRILAIIGRPNVGKSRLFNRLVQKRKAIVHDQPGITRDRLYGESEWGGVTFTVVDTGGLIPASKEALNQDIWRQSFFAIEEADVVICLFDGKEGLHPADEDLIANLRKLKKPVFYVVNKVDSAANETQLTEFARTGLSPLYDISAEHGRKIGDLLDEILPHLILCNQKGARHFMIKPNHKEPGTFLLPTVAIIGRPNVGKSSLLNQLAQEERMIVHEEAGTTRDAIDTLLIRGNKTYRLIDTAGIKRKRTAETDVAYWSVLRSYKAIEAADVVCLLADGIEGLTHQDVQLVHHAWEQTKPVLLLINKWDQVKTEWKEYQEWCEERLGSVKEIPKLAISAKTGFHCDRIWNEVEHLLQGINKRVSTPNLNRWLRELQQSNPPPAYQNRPVKFFYATQTEKNPPQFILFTNQPKGIKKPYEQFLKHQLLELMKVPMIPIQLIFKAKS